MAAAISPVALSDRLGMVTIAEGSETLEQIAHLKQIGCEYSQGYHFCKPLPTGYRPRAGLSLQLAIF